MDYKINNQLSGVQDANIQTPHESQTSLFYCYLLFPQSNILILRAKLPFSSGKNTIEILIYYFGIHNRQILKGIYRQFIRFFNCRIIIIR